MNVNHASLLDLGETFTDLNDVVSGAIIDFGMFVTQIIQDVPSQRPISASHFIDDKVFVWEVLEKIF